MLLEGEVSLQPEYEFEIGEDLSDLGSVEPITTEVNVHYYDICRLNLKERATVAHIAAGFTDTNFLEFLILNGANIYTISSTSKIILMPVLSQPALGNYDGLNSLILTKFLLRTISIPDTFATPLQIALQSCKMTTRHHLGILSRLAAAGGRYKWGSRWWNEPRGIPP